MTADLQSAVNDAVAFGGSQTVFLPAGQLTYSPPLRVGCPAGQVNTTTIHIQGAGRNFAGQGNGTTIVCPSDAGPAVSFEGARDSSLSHLSIEGPYADQLRWKFSGLDLAAWPGKRSRYSPSSGVAVDQFADGTNGPFSSGVLLEDVEIAGFEVGFVTQPSGIDGQGEFPTLRNCRIRDCAWAISISQTQMRLLNVEAVDFLSVHTVLTNRSHGKQEGQVNGNFRSCSFNTVARILDLDQSRCESVEFESCYGELVGSVGAVASGGARNAVRTILRSCDLDLRLDPTSRTLANGDGSILIDGGTWTTADLAVIDCECEVKGTRLRPAYYESGKPFTVGRRKAANASLGLITRLGSQTRPLDRFTSAYFPLPLVNDSQVGYDGPAPTLPRPLSFAKSAAQFIPGVAGQPDTILPLVTGLPVVSPAGWLVQDDASGITTWIVIGNPTGKRWTLERVNNLGSAVDAVNGRFFLQQN